MTRATPRMLALIALAAVTIAIVGCAPGAADAQPAPSTVEVSDSEIAANVKLAFHDQGLEGHELIRVEVQDGRVVLEGRATAKVAARAVEIAKKIDGVDSVESRIAVDG